MNDYFLKLLMQERQHQLHMEARGNGLRSGRRKVSFGGLTPALITLLSSHLFRGSRFNGITPGAGRKGL